METDALRTPLGISLPISPATARFLHRVKAGSEHLPDNSMALGSSPCLPEPGGKFPTDFRGWNQGHEKHVDGTNPFFHIAKYACMQE